MEQVKPGRLRRRSVRHLRRSSGFFGDSYTSSIEVEQVEAVVDDGVAVTYGSIWVEHGSQEKNCNQQVVNCPEEQLVCVQADSCVSSKNLDEQDLLPASSSYTGLASELLDSHNPLVIDECLTPFEAVITGSSLRELSPSSVNDVRRRQLVQEQEFRNQQISQSDDAVDCGDETLPQTGTSSVSVNPITNHLHHSFHHDKAVCSQKDVLSPSITGPNTFSENNPGTMFDKSFCNEEKLSEFTESTKKICTEVYDHNLGDEFETLTSNGKPTSLNKEVRTNFTGKLQISDHNTDSIFRAESRRKSENDLVKNDTCRHPDYEPKKKKRLSLNKIRTNIFEERECTFAESHAEKYREFKHNDHITDTLPETNENDVGVTSKGCASQLVDATKGTGNLDNFMDLEVSEEMLTNFDAEKYLMSCDKRGAKKKSKQSKAKATRRSSRHFNLCEMPLSDISLERIPNVQLLSPKINDFTAEVWSPKFSKSCEDKENTPEKLLDASRRKRSLEDYNQALLESAIKLDDSQLLDVAFIEEVVEDFANLCVDEKTCTDSAGPSLPARQRSDGKRHSGTYGTIASFINSCKDTDDNIDIIQIDCQQDDIQEKVISLQSTFGCVNNSSNNTDVKCDTDSVILDHKVENIFQDNSENTEKGQSISPTPNDDLDMDELPSPGSPSAKDEIPPLVNYESTMCMRVRRSRKSWGMCQPNNSNEEKKIPRQATRKKKPDKKSLQILVIDNSQASSPINDAISSPQSSDIKAACERGTPQNSSDDEDISPGLLCLYKNKNFVMPQPRSWETIKESPKTGKQIFSKQRRKCFLEFENGRTNAKLQRRHRKASDIYKKIAVKPVAVTKEEFERKMLDAQLLVESL